MKNKILVFAFMVAMVYNGHTQASDNLPTSGSCAPTDENGYRIGSCAWSFDASSGTLTISGSGAMADYEKESNPFYDSNISSIDQLQGAYRTAAPWGIYSNEITTVNVDNNITSLGKRAFMGMAKITDVHLPDGLDAIGDSAFNNAFSLKNINIPNSVTSIGGHAFRGTVSLESINIPDSVISIGTRAFYNAFGEENTTKSIVIGDSVQLIGNEAFLGLSDVTVVYCQNGENNHGGLTCAQVIASQNTKFSGLVQAYQKINDTLYSVTSNGQTKYYSSLDKLAQGIEMKRIYTVEEARKAAGNVNHVRIRYK